MKRNGFKAVPALVISGMLVAMLGGCGEDANSTTGGATGNLPLTIVGDEEVTNIMQLVNIGEYVTAGDYKNLQVNLQNSYVADPETVNYYASYYYSYAAKSASTDNLITDRAVENGDMIHLDYTGYKDGEEFEGGSTAGLGTTLLIGSGSYIEGFEEGLVGVMPGETVDLNLRFPDDYGSEDLAGAEVVFNVTVNGIFVEKDLIDTWASQNGMSGIESYDEIVAYYEEYLTETAASSYETDLENAIGDALIENATYLKEFPGSLILKYQNDSYEILDYYASYYGYDRDTLAQLMVGTSADEYAVTYSYKQLQLGAVCRDIAEKEGMTLTDEELDARINQYLTSLGYSEEAITETLATADINDFKLQFMQDDVLELVMNNCTVTTLDD